MQEIWGPPNLLFFGTGDSSPVERRLGREADPISSCAVDRNAWYRTSTSTYSFTAWCFITDRNDFMYVYKPIESANSVITCGSKWVSLYWLHLTKYVDTVDCVTETGFWLGITLKLKNVKRYISSNIFLWFVATLLEQISHPYHRNRKRLISLQKCE